MPTGTEEYVLLTAARWSDPIDTSLLETILIERESFCWGVFPPCVFQKNKQTLMSEINH